MDKSFMELDANLDGVVSNDEAERSEVLSEKFTSVDTNSDGYIDHSEFSAFETSGSEGSPAMDSGQSKSQSKSENGDSSGKSSSAMDSSGSETGAVSGSAGSAAGGGADSTTGAPHTDEPLTTSFSSLDVDADNQISKDEAAADPELVDLFSTADGNGDGFIDESEFAAFEINQSGGVMESPPDSPSGMGGGSSANERDPHYMYAILRIAQAGSGYGSDSTMDGGGAGGTTGGSTTDGMGGSTDGTTGDAMGGTTSRPTTSLPSFTALDADGDAVISPDEAAASATLMGSFTQADTNRDGFIDRSEFSALESGAGGAAGSGSMGGPAGSDSSGGSGFGSDSGSDSGFGSNLPPGDTSHPSGQP